MGQLSFATVYGLVSGRADGILESGRNSLRIIYPRFNSQVLAGRNQLTLRYGDLCFNVEFMSGPPLQTLMAGLELANLAGASFYRFHLAYLRFYDRRRDHIIPSR